MGYKPRNKKVIRHYPRLQNRDGAGIITYLERCKNEAFENNRPEQALWLEVIAAVIRDIVAPPQLGRNALVDRDETIAWLCSSRFAADRELTFEFAGLDPGLAATFAKKLGLVFARKSC
jgi:hypothetical protein